jgi:hypothetical protein
MKKYLVFVAVVVASIYLFRGIIQNGRLEKYLDAHPDNSLNPAVEYYWGMLLSFANHREGAVYRLSRVVSKYPKSAYAADAWTEYIGILDDMGYRNRVLEESKKFIQSEYSKSPKAELIKRKIAIIEHGI